MNKRTKRLDSNAGASQGDPACSPLTPSQARAILEATPDGLIVVDHNGRIVTVNRQTEAMFGYPARTLRGRPIETLIPERFGANDRRHRQRYGRRPATRRMGSRLDLYGRRADGSEFPVDVALSRLRERDEEVTLAFVRDITERRHAEERLTLANAVLHRMAADEPLQQTLEAVCRLVEDERPGTVCAVLLPEAEGRRLRFGAGPGASDALRNILNGRARQTASGLAGAAARSRTPVVVADLASETRWKRQAASLLALGYRSCVALGVRSPGDRLLAVLVVVHPAASPRPADAVGPLLVAANLVRIAAEHDLSARALRESERRLATLIDNLPGMVYRCLNDRDWTMQWVSRGCWDLTGFPPSDLVRGRVKYASLIEPGDRERVWDEVQEAIHARRAFQALYRIRTRSGEAKWVWEQGRGVFDPGGHLLAIEGFIADITGTRRASEERARLVAILEATTDIVGTTDPNGRVLYLNEAGRRLFGIESGEDLSERSVGEWLPKRLHDVIKREAMPAAVRDGVWRGEGALVSKDGQEIPVSQVVIAHRSADGSVEFFSMVARDISEQKRFEGQLLRAANHDPLTGLFNRRRFEEDLERELARARVEGTKAALLFLDFDDFKAVNDSLGHRAGDEALASLASFLRSQVSPAAALARVGGDEFGILLPDTTPTEARGAARGLLDALRRYTVTIGGQVIRTTASAGMAILPDHGSSAGELLAHADIALFEAKERGRNALAVYSRRADGQASSGSRLHWRRRLAEALERDRLVFYAQPIVDLNTRRAEHHELLLRLRNDDGSLALPGSFLDIAERFGLIRDIDRRVVQEAIHLLASMEGETADTRLSVNLSGKVFADDHLVPLIRRELHATGVDPSRLVLEITETAAIRDLAEAQRFVRSLKSLGCQFALDDFGVGFASFSHLKHFPLDYVKIDGSFIRHLTRDDVDQHVVRALVEVTKGLGCATVAEFVTDEETVGLLRAFGVDFGQGFHLGEPVPVASAGPAIATRHHLAA